VRGVGAVNKGERRAVFFDRDGVLNRAVVRAGRPHSPATLEELVVPDDVPEALARLHGAGFLLLGATNQPEVARGTQRREVVETMHAVLLARLPLAEIFVCYHDDADGCDCRKPRPGLLLLAAERYGIDLRTSVMVGDRWKDIEAGRRAGCATVLLGSGWGQPAHGVVPDFTAASIAEAVDWIVRRAAAADPRT
jgi:D-glycero-D-manno-heptose 1,7-bisphosphate phosphatase